MYGWVQDEDFALWRQTRLRSRTIEWGVCVRNQHEGTRHWNTASNLFYNNNIFSLNTLNISFERQQLMSKKITEDETFTSSVKTTASVDWWLDVAQARASMGGRERGRRVFEDGVTCACNNKQWRSETRSAPRLAFTNSKRVYTSHIRRDLIRRSQVKVILSGLVFSWECSCIRCYIQFIHFECKRSFAKIRRTVGVSELGQF